MNRQPHGEREAEREERERYREIMGFNRSSEERRAERIARARESAIQPRKLSEILGHENVPSIRLVERKKFERGGHGGPGVSVDRRVVDLT